MLKNFTLKTNASANILVRGGADQAVYNNNLKCIYNINMTTHQEFSVNFVSQEPWDKP